MTIVIAQRRGDEMLLLSDTMINDPGQRRSDVMPGRLKIVTIGPRVTVAFAGNADPADVAIRTARIELFRSSFAGALEVLRADSREGKTDYIVSSHLERGSLLRIRNGGAAEVPDICAIGHEEPFKELIEAARVAPDDSPLARGDLRFRFLDRLTTAKDLGDSIGGFPIAVSATLSEHRYLAHTSAYTFELPPIQWGETAVQSIDEVYTGSNHFTMSVMPSRTADVPVVGVCLLQACTGYVFSPIEHYLPFKVELAPAGAEWEGSEREMFNRLQDAIDSHAAAVTIGGT